MKNPIPERARIPIGIIGIITISGAMGIISGLLPISHIKELFIATITGSISGTLAGQSGIKVDLPTLAIGSVLLTLCLIIPYAIGLAWQSSEFTTQQATLLVVIAMAIATLTTIIIRVRKEKLK